MIERHRDQRADDRPQPIDPPAVPNARDQRRAEAARRIGAGPRDRRLEPDHERIERRKQRRREPLEPPVAKKREQAEDQREAGHRLAGKRPQRAIGCAGRGGAEGDAAAHRAPGEQGQRADRRARHLRRDVAQRMARLELAHQPEGKRHHRIDVGTALPAERRERDCRAGRAEQEAGHQPPQRGIGQQAHHRTARAEIDDDDRQADAEQQRRAGGLGGEQLPRHSPVSLAHFRRASPGQTRAKLGRVPLSARGRREHATTASEQFGAGTCRKHAPDRRRKPHPGICAGLRQHMPYSEQNRPLSMLLCRAEGRFGLLSLGGLMRCHDFA